VVEWESSIYIKEEGVGRVKSGRGRVSLRTREAVALSGETGQKGYRKEKGSILSHGGGNK